MRRGATALLLVVAGLVGVTTVAQAQMVLGSCPANSNWSATWTVGYESNVVGEFFHFDPNTGLGGLDPATIPYGLSVFTVEQILRTRVANTDSLSFRVSGGELPDGTVLSFGGMELTVDADSDTTTDGREQWSLFNLGLNPTWVAGQEMRVCADLPPGLVSATVDGTSLVLDYDQALDTGSVPDEEDDYTVDGERHCGDGLERVGLRHRGDADPGGGGHPRADGDGELRGAVEWRGAGRIGHRRPVVQRPAGQQRLGRHQQLRHRPAGGRGRGGGRQGAEGGHR